MKWAALQLVVPAILGYMPLVAVADGQSAYAAGAALGYQQNDAGVNRDTITSNATGQMGELYRGNVTRPESLIFGGGKGDMGLAGMGRKLSCSIYTPAAGTTLTAEQKAENAECDAVNMFQGGMATPPVISSSDPLLGPARRAAADPSALITEQGISLTAGELNCVPVVQTIPATFSTETCIAGSDVKVQSCRRYKVVTVTQGYYGMGGAETMLAPFNSSLYVYAKSGEEGLRLHTPIADFLVPASGTFGGDVLGTSSGYRVVISSNGCASGVCRGSAMYQILRDNGTWWSLSAASFNQELNEIFECPFDKTLYEGNHWLYGSSNVTLNGVGCPSNGAVTIQSITRTVTDYAWGSGSLSLGVTTVGSVNLGISSYGPIYCDADGNCAYGQIADLPASLTFNDGTFNLTYRAKNDSSNDAWGWFTTTWGLPSRKDSFVVTEIDECGELESLAQ